MGIAKTIERHFNGFLEMAWPPACGLCQRKIVKNSMLCQGCWSDVSFIQEPNCKYCGGSLPDELGMVCENCLEDPRPWDRGYAAVEYCDIARDMVLRLKNNGGEHMAPIIADMIFHTEPSAFEEIDYIMPMPAHWSRQLKRGYNQASLIAYYLSQRTKIPMLDSAVKRNRATAHQKKGSDFEKRFNNVYNAFVLGRDAIYVEGKHVAIIDDVMTSGASLHFVAETLQQAEPSKISVFVFARAGQER